MMSVIGTPLFWAGVSVMGIFFLLSVVLAFFLSNQVIEDKRIAEKFNKAADDCTKKAEEYRAREQENIEDVENHNEEAVKDYTRSATLKKDLAKKYEERVRRKKTGVGVLFTVSICTSMILISLLLRLRKKNNIDATYHYLALMNQNSNVSTVNGIFKKYEREYKSEQDWARNVVHLDWYSDTFSDKSTNITKEHMNKYYKNVRDILMELPYNTNILNAPYDFDEFDRLSAIFYRAVNASIGTWSPEDLWDAFEAGSEIAKIHNTSVIVFQTYVLAEGAHSNAYDKSRNDPDTLKYLAGATEKMEEFLKFTKKDPGDGSKVSVSSMSFRIGKMDYREGLREKDDDNSEARHFLLKAYEEFQYSIEKTGISDKDYVTYLYYCSLACLHLMSYVEDSELEKELCELELERWAEFKEYVGDEFNNMKVENNSDLQEIIDDLGNFIKNLPDDSQ